MITLPAPTRVRVRTPTPPPVILGSGPKVMCLTLPSDQAQEAEYNLTHGTARR